MTTKKENLIKGLKTAIFALENNTIFYAWEKQASCNCGVVAQAMLHKKSSDIEDGFSEVITRIVQATDKGVKPKYTWKEGIQRTCSITGKTNVSIFNELFSIGMSPSDLTHLEYLENPVILTRAGIKTKKIVLKEIKTGEVKKIVSTPVIKKRKGIAGFFGYTDSILTSTEQITETFETRNVEVTDDNYYANKSNLILYLKAWVSILEEDVNKSANLSKEQIQEELLKAVAGEDFERAAKLRDELVTA